MGSGNMVQAPWMDVRAAMIGFDTPTPNPSDAAPPEWRAIVDQETARRPCGHDDPRAVVVLGAPCSGKSTVTTRAKIDESEVVIVDSDRVKPALARIGERRHEAARDVSRMILWAAVRNRQHVYVEGASHIPAKSVAVLAGLRLSGYHVTTIFLDVPLAIAAERARARAAEGAHDVPYRIVMRACADLPRAASQFEGWSLEVFI